MKTTNKTDDDIHFFLLLLVIVFIAVIAKITLDHDYEILFKENSKFQSSLKHNQSVNWTEVTGSAEKQKIEKIVFVENDSYLNLLINYVEV